MVALVVLAVCGLVGLLVGQPLVFPSLAPTVMLFVESPHQQTSAPRSVVIGHGVALVAGFSGLHLSGLASHPPVTEEGLTLLRVVVAAAAVGVTAFVLSRVKAPHPPAGATALLFGLGVLTTWADVATVVGGVLLLTVVGVGINRLLGVRQSLWGPEGESGV